MSENINLVGKGVRLRSTVPGDAPALIAIRKTDEVSVRWRGEVLEAEFSDDLNDDEMIRLTIETEGRIIGLVQFAEEPDAEYRHASIDIYIDPAVHRRGYGTESIATLVDHLFDEWDHHRLTIDPDSSQIRPITTRSEPESDRSYRSTYAIGLVLHRAHLGVGLGTTDRERRVRAV